MDRIIVDGHCDTITRLMQNGEGLLKNNLHIDLQRSRMLGSHVQFFASFFDPRKVSNHMDAFLGYLKKLNEEIEINKNLIEKATCFDDITRIVHSGKTAAVVSVEGGELLEGNLENVKKVYDLGVRCMSLTWNYSNQLGTGVMEDRDKGLTNFGHEVCSEMNRLGMIIDVSHLSFKGFWNVIETTKDPIIASHSNAKGVCKVKRNLCDRQLVAIKDNGGVIGINYYPPFLSCKETASIYDIIKHIDYICSIAGPKHVGLGSDFDGFEKTPNGVEDITKIEDILNLLAKENYTQEQIDDIAGRNFLRIISRVVG